MPRYANIVQDRLELRAAQLHDEAGSLAHGNERQALVNRAIKMEAASLVIEGWTSSPGLRSPR